MQKLSIGLAILLMACGSGNDKKLATAPADAKNTVRIGLLFPMSGPWVKGPAWRNAAEMAAAEINASGGVLGRPIELLIADTQTVPEVAATQAQFLIRPTSHRDRWRGGIESYDLVRQHDDYSQWRTAGIPCLYFAGADRSRRPGLGLADRCFRPFPRPRSGAVGLRRRRSHGGNPICRQRLWPRPFGCLHGRI